MIRAAKGESMSGERIRRGLSLALVALGLLVILGWLADVQALKSVVPGLSTMKFNSAVAFLLTGTGLLAIGGGRAGDLLAVGCGAALMAIGAVTIAQYAAGANFGIDELFVADRGTLRGSGHPGRMSPLTATAWMALGTALLLLAAGRGRTAVGIAHGLCAYAGFAAFLAAAGYAFGAEAFWGIGFYTNIAVHTAFGLLAATAATILTRREDGWLKPYRDTPRARKLLLQLLIAAFALPLGLSLLVLAGPAVGAYDAAFAFALFVPLVALSFMALSLLIAGASREGELALRESEERYRVIFEKANDYIMTFDLDQRVTDCNPAVCEAIGYSREEIIGRCSAEFMDFDQAAQTREMVARKLSEGGSTRHTLRVNRRDGTPLIWEINSQLTFDESGAPTGLHAIARDVTERFTIEAALRESQSRLRGIVESAMDAIITIDAEQRILLFNPAAERMFGWEAEHVLGGPISRLIPERHRDGHHVHIRAFREGGVTNRRMGALGAISGVRASGEEFPVEASISNVEVGGEQLSTVILRDITERKQSDEARTLLAREVDHRAKNAMAVAQALVNLTRAPTVETYVQAVTGRISALARAHSLLSRSEWRGAPLDEVVRDELSPYASDGQVELAGPPVSLAPLAVQPLSLMFHELATNAVKHGALSSAEGRVAVRWEAGGDGGMLTIEWTESGGPAADAPGSPGFGSQLLRQVAERQLSAKLETSWRPEGLTARVVLPPRTFACGESPPREPAQAARETAAGPSGAGARILIVEDEALLAMNLSEELGRLGWVIVGPASTLEEAEALIGRESSVDAAILDVNLAGESAHRLADLLRQRGMPFLFCTGYEEPDTQARFADVPVVRKPATAETVGAALAALLRR
jgi:PAS domain S-box-containing protein